METPNADRRAYKAEWRKNNQESIRTSNRKYYEKQRAKRAELVSEYTKTLSQQFPGFILMLYRGEPLLSGIFPKGLQVTITGIGNPDETATITVTKDERVLDILREIPHDKLNHTINWEKVKLAWK